MSLNRFSILTITLGVVIGLAGCAAPGGLSDDINKNAAWRKTVPVFDVHEHIDAHAIDKTLAAMDANFISRAVDLTAGTNLVEFAASKKLFDEKGKDRFVLYVDDVYQNFKIEDPDFGTQCGQVIEDCVKLGARGFKVQKILGLNYKDAAGKLVAVDDPRLEGMWQACEKLNLPISIHSADPKAFWLPVDEKNERYDELKSHPFWAFGGGKFPSHEAVLQQLENVIARHPKITFVSVHFGNNAEDIDYVAGMLKKYPNYNVDLAARIPEIGRHDADKLKKMFIEYQDRILFGTDFMVSTRGYILGAGPRLTDEAEVKKFFDAHWNFLETNNRQIETPTPIQGHWKIDGIGLPKDVLEKIYYKNAERIILKK